MQCLHPPFPGDSSRRIALQRQPSPSVPTLLLESVLVGILQALQLDSCREQRKGSLTHEMNSGTNRTEYILLNFLQRALLELLHDDRELEEVVGMLGFVEGVKARECPA